MLFLCEWLTYNSRLALHGGTLLQFWVMVAFRSAYDTVLFFMVSSRSFCGCCCSFGLCGALKLSRLVVSCSDLGWLSYNLRLLCSWLALRVSWLFVGLCSWLATPPAIASHGCNRVQLKRVLILSVILVQSGSHQL